MFRFLELAEVEEMHLDSLNAYGGTPGTRDQGAIESAIASTINTALYASGDVFDVAAAYAFHIAEAAALAFLSFNQAMRKPSPDDLVALYDAMIAIARHELDKAGLAALFRKLFA